MKKTLILISGIFTVMACGFLAGCGDDSKNGEQQCAPGTLDCECVEGGNCNAGLSCVDNKCVSPPDGGGSTDTTVPFDTVSGDTAVDAGDQPTQSEMTLTNNGNGVVCGQGVAVGPADNDSWDDHWGAGIGFNLCQSSTGADKTAIGDCAMNPQLSRFIGIRATLSGELPPELRINLEDDIDDADNPYIVVDKNNVETPQEFLFENARVFYEEDTSEQGPPDLSRLLSVQFQVASQLGMIDEFNFCVESVEIIASEEVAGGDAGDMADAGDASVDTGDASVDTTPVDTGSDTVVCTPDSTFVVADESNWIHGCTNFLGIQGDWYSYTDGD